MTWEISQTNLRVVVKAKELEDLTEAVRTENHRLYALQEQRKYGVPFIRSQRSTSHAPSFESGNAALVQKPPEEFLQLNSKGIDWERVASEVGLPLFFLYGKAMLNGTLPIVR